MKGNMKSSELVLRMRNVRNIGPSLRRAGLAKISGTVLPRSTLLKFCIQVAPLYKEGLYVQPTFSGMGHWTWGRSMNSIFSRRFYQLQEESHLFLLAMVHWAFLTRLTSFCRKVSLLNGDTHTPATPQIRMLSTETHLVYLTCEFDGISLII